MLHEEALSSAAPPRVIGTGAGGFVGRWMVRRLMVSAPPGSIVVPLFMEHEPHEIGNALAVQARIAAIRPTAVVHLAAVAAPGEAWRDMRRAWEVNVIGTLNLAEAILKHAPRARLVHAGSSEVYGHSFNKHPAPVGENAALEPASAYGATKAAAEILLRQMAIAEGLDVVLTRPFNHTGPEQSARYVVASFAEQVARIEAGQQMPVIRVGHLSTERDFLDVRDVVELYARAAMTTNPLPPALTVNVSTGHPRPISNILEILSTLARATFAVETDSSRLTPQPISRASGDPSLAASIFAWRPSITFERTVADVLDHWRAKLAAG